MAKTALITGASGGIGLELARIHARNGDNLVLVARNAAKLDEIKNELEAKHGIMVSCIVTDLAVQGSAAVVYDEISRRGISVDYLINNAGFGDFSFFAESNWKKQEEMINVNILALAHLTRLVLPDMIERGEGRIMNLASTASFQPGPRMSVYFASKAFVLSFSEALANEVKDRGITVTALCPGSTESGFHKALGENVKMNAKRYPAAAEVAEYGYRAMLKGRRVAVPGLKNSFLATMVRFAPRSVVTAMARKIQEKKHT